MNEALSNNPPGPATGHATFTIKRASGEIEIRASDHERLWQEQLKHPDYKFGDPLRFSSTIVGVKGHKIEV